MSKWTTFTTALCAAGVMLWVGSGIAKAPAEPAEIVKDRLGHLEVGKPQSYGRLTVFPILGGSIAGLDYMTLDEAMRQNTIEITESGSGTVNEILIRNKSGRRVFMMDGEEFIGAKQNRVLNTSVLIGADQTAKVPVSCVEQGRWAGTSMKFGSGETQLFARARQASVASVNRNFAAKPADGARADQSQVWSNVAKKRENLAVGEGSGPMHEAYVKYRKDINDYVKAFRTVPGQVGVVFAINNEIVGADTFDQSRTLERLFKKLVKSYALDAIETPRGATRRTVPTVTQRDAKKFLELALAKNVSFRDYDSPGEGRDVRISSKNIQGSSLVAASRPVHIALFVSSGEKPIPLDTTNIRPPSQRRTR